MKTRIVHTKIWDDNWFISLSRASKLLFVHLITNENIGLTGIYEIPDAKIQYQTGLTSSELEESKKELSDKVGFFNGWVKIQNIDKYQSFNGPKNEAAKEKELEKISPEVIDRVSIGYRYGIDTLNNHKSETINHKSIKKGGVGENKPTDEEMQEIAEKYKVPLSFVLSKWDDLENYCLSKGKKYSNYKAALMNWVKRDAIERIDNAKQSNKKTASDYSHLR